ncbi:Fe(3+) ABC transporter substrate-binding protein [Lutibaculum baratangense]|uniref:Ferric iron ABC transporter, iron-binding protein n=1 Tax=Lutibaculum baratangense AMV1 TaxID=631454 RepID=V4TBC4_9HYPH|nr:Fe(3+) ABC transporter substrate-binding protein [Lutibaculum baratangense]ESR23698.1 Ferric iron ABC transporter, iron-binding protein [Lutibaculum baratangense AMV1]
MQLTQTRRLGQATRAILGGLVLAVGSAGAASAQGEVNVYTTREPGLIQPLLDRYTEETGTEVNVLFGGDELVERIQAEGRNTPADLLITVDIGTLKRAKDMGITQPMESEEVAQNVPEKYRDPEGHWTALSLRARVVYASRERVEQDEITYDELADPKWKGRICTRTGQHPYNIGLFASVIAHEGEDAAREWLEGVKENLARKPTGNDRAGAKGIFAGECDLALANTYYMGLMQTNQDEPEQQEWAKSIKVLFPKSDDRGTHVNVSGAVLVANAPHAEEARKLLAFLTSDEAQQLYAETNHEYPVKEGVEVSETVGSWGELEADDLPLVEIGELRARASELVDEVGFDEGPSS